MWWSGGDAQFHAHELFELQQHKTDILKMTGPAGLRYTLAKSVELDASERDRERTILHTCDVHALRCREIEFAAGPAAQLETSKLTAAGLSL